MIQSLNTTQHLDSTSENEERKTVSPDSDITSQTAPEEDECQECEECQENGRFYCDFESDASSNTLEFFLDESDSEFELDMIECNDPNCAGYDIDPRIELQEEESKIVKYLQPQNSSITCDSSGCSNYDCAIKSEYCLPVSRKVKKSNGIPSAIKKKFNAVDSAANENVKSSQPVLDSSSHLNLSTTLIHQQEQTKERNSYSITTIFLISGILFLFIASKKVFCIKNKTSL